MNVKGGSARFFRLAERTFAFKGVMQARYLEEEERRTKGGARHATPSATPKTPTLQRVALAKEGGQVVQVESTERSYLHDLVR